MAYAMHGRAEQDAAGYSDNDDSQDGQHADRLVIVEEELGTVLPKGEVDFEEMFEAKEEPLDHDANIACDDVPFDSIEADAQDVALVTEPALAEDQTPVQQPVPVLPEVHVPSPVLQPAVEQVDQSSSGSAPQVGDNQDVDDGQDDDGERGADECRYVVPVRSTRSGKPLEPTSPTVKAAKSRKSTGKKDSSPGPKISGVKENSKSETKKASKKKKESDSRKATKQPEVESTEEGDQKYFTFNPSPDEFLVPGPDGQKWYYCDICEGLYKRAFSLKRHYLRSHINYAHLTVRDIANCGIAAGNKMSIVQVDVAGDDAPGAVDASSDKPKEDIGGVYQCYTCDETFDEKEEIRQHLSSHRKQLSDEALVDSEVGLAEAQDEAPTLEPAIALEPTAIPDAAPILDPAPATLPIADKTDDQTNEDSVRMENDLLSINLDESSSSNVETIAQNEVKEESFMCFFCDKFYGSAQKRHQHQLRIHLRPKRRKTKIIYACEYCENAEPIYRTLEDLFKHMCDSHKDVYFACLSCEIRYPDKDSYVQHQSLLHSDNKPILESVKETVETQVVPTENSASSATVEESDTKSSEEFQCTICQKLLVSEQNLNRHYRLKHDNRGKKKKKKPDTLQLSEENVSDRLDPETLFYSQISTNIRENLLHHLDGKLDSQELFEREEEEPSLVPTVDSLRSRISSDSVPGPSTSFSSPESLIDAMPTIKLKNVNRRRSSDGSRTWEKYAFPKKYDGKGGMTSYLRDMSHVDIHTQVTMRQNARRLGSKEGVQSPTPSTAGGSTTRSYNLRSSHEETPMLDFPSILSLTQSSTGIQYRRTASAATLEKSMLSVSFNPPELPKPEHDKKLKPPKVPAADYLNAAWRQGPFPMVNGRAELSGEWVRPKNYLCAACDARFKNLYDLEDHKWNFHPNVWCTHFEFDDAALVPFTAVGIKSPSELNRRAIHATGTIMSAPTVPATQQCDMTCTKCQHVSHTAGDLHRHMLDCGGDATWQLMMAGSPGSSGNRRNKKWRPFGSRRRRPPGRRGLKRNIPNTPQRPRSNNPKTRGGDADTIQKMIANLPAKRATRRVIQFKEDEIKTRSQATMASVPFPVSQSALHKASRALVDRSKTASSSKPGHMPKARPLRLQTNTGAVAAPSTSVSEPDHEDISPEFETDDVPMSEEKRPSSVTEKTAPLVESVAAEVPSSSATTLKTITNSEPSGDRRNLRTNTILDAMRLAMLDSNPDSDDSLERKMSLRSEKLSMEMQVQAMEQEDEENALRQATTPSSSVKEIHLPPAPSLELTTVQFLAKSMPPNFCAGCQRSFCNNSNRDRHLKVCPFLLQIAGDGVPKLRKQLEYRNHPLVLTSLASSPPDFNLPALPASEEKAKSPESTDSRIADKLLFGEAAAEKKPASANKKGKDKKKQIVGIRKRTVPGDSSEGGVVVKESFLVRVETSSLNEAINTDEDKEQETSDSESPTNQSNKNRKPRKSDHVEKIVLKLADAQSDDNLNDSKGKRRSGRSLTPAEDDESRRKSVRVSSANTTTVVDEDDLPLKKFTRARNASPAKIPVMRIDRSSSGVSADKQQPQTSTSMVSPRNSRQSTGKSHGSKRNASDQQDDEAEYDTDEFEEILNKMQPDEIKNLDVLQQFLEGDESESSDDDLPLVPKQKANEEYSSEDDLPLKPKATSKRSPIETNQVVSSDEEIEQSSSKRASRKKSSGTPIKKLQEIASSMASMAEDLSDLQSSMNKSKTKTKKGKSNEEEPNAAATPSIKVVVKVTKSKDDEDDVSPSRRRSLRTKEVEKIQPETQDSKSGKKKGKESEPDPETEVNASGKSSKKRAKVDSPVMEPKERADSQTSSLSDETLSVKSSKKRIKLSSEVDSLPEMNQNSNSHNHELSEEILRNSDVSKSKKKTKTPAVVPISMPEPNPETVNELDPNLIGELTPRLSRKRFNELSTTTTPSIGAKPSAEPEPTSAPLLKSSKSKSKTKSSETLGETLSDAPPAEVTSKSNKSKSKSKKKAKGKSDEVERTEDLDETSEEKSPKNISKKFLELPESDSKSGKRKPKGVSVLDESAEDATATNRGKRPRLDDGAADSADNDSVITESDSSEIAKGNRRSRSRAENLTDLSETESTSASVDMAGAATMSNSKLTVKKQGKRKSKGKPQLSADCDDDGQNRDSTSTSTEITQPNKRMKMDGVADGSSQKELLTNSVEDNEQSTLNEDTTQVPSETAAVPASNVGQNPPAAASPTPAEAPETNSKPKKKGSTYYCYICQRHYSTAFNLHKHFASAYHKSNLNSYCNHEKVKTAEGEDKFDLPDGVAANHVNVAREEPKSQENIQKAPSGTICATAENESSRSSSSEQLKEKSSECEKIMEEREKLPELEISPRNAGVPEVLNPPPVSEMVQEPVSIAPEGSNKEGKDQNCPLPAGPAASDCEGSKANEPHAETPPAEAPHAEAAHVEAPSQQYAEAPQTSQEAPCVSGPSTYSQNQYNQQHYEQYNYNQPHYQEHYGQPQQYGQQQPNPSYNHQEPQPFVENSQPALQTLQTFDHSQPATQPSGHSYDHQQVPNQHYNQQQAAQQHPPQPYNNYNSSGNWQGSDSWGPWRIPDVIPSYSQEEASGGMGLGSILDSVNQVLSGDGGMPDCPIYPEVTSLSDLQHAIGANDEEMAVLRQLGEGSLRELIGPHHQVAPAEEAELLDLDNQKKASDRSTPGPSSGPEATSQPARVSPFVTGSRPGSSRSSQSSSSSGSGAAASSASAPPRTKGSLSTGPSLNELYEDKQMWCHLCHRRFLGLAAMKTHMESFHAHAGEGRKFERRSMVLSAEGSSEPRLCCSVCKEMVTDEKALQQHNSEMHPPRSEQPKNKNSEGLRTQMSSALGGLLDRALKSYMSKSCAPNASNSETDKSRLTLGILSKLALRHQSSLSLPSGSGVSIGTIGGVSGPSTSMLVDQLVAAKLGMRRGSGSSMRRRSSGASSPGIDGSFGCPVCHERFAFEGSMKRHLMSHRRDPPEQPQEIISAPESRPESPMETCMEPAVGLDGAFLCSVCGINFKTPSEVIEHQRMEHILSRRTSLEEDGEGAEEPHIDSETAEKAEKWIENHTKLQSSPKGRHPLGKDVKNRKVAIAVESALLERTEEMRVKAEAALRELNQTRKPAKGSSKEAKWGVDAVKFTVTKEPPLVGVFGPTLENEKKQINIPVVRKTQNNAPRFSFLGKKGGMFKGSDDAKSEKEKIDVYDFDEANKGSSSRQQNDDSNPGDEPIPVPPKPKKKRAPKKETQAKKAAAAGAAASSQTTGEKGANADDGVVKPKAKPRVRKSTSKKAKAPSQGKGLAPTGETMEGGHAPSPSNATQPQPQPMTPEPSKDEEQVPVQPLVAVAPPAPAPAPVPAPLPREPQPLTPVEGPPASLDAKEQSEQ